jgi:putative PIN family toxin of toxin-antitoxin system
MVDANIIISAILFPNSVVAKAFNHLIENHNLVLSKYTIYEIEDVFNEKFSHRIMEMKEFIQKIPFELYEDKKIENKKYPNIRDKNDLPVLINAIESKVDLLITGDKDFDDIIINKPKIIKPRKYIDEYME